MNRFLRGALAAALATWLVGGGAAGQGPSVAPSSPGVELSLVGLGDSIPGGHSCEAPCRSYVALLGDLAAAALGRPVTVTNLATNDGLTSDGLLQRVQTDASHRTAIAGADLVTLQVGFNDWQGSCMFDGLEACLTRNGMTAAANVGAILDEIAALRDGRPTAIRVVTSYDPYVGTARASEWWGFEEADRAAFEAGFGAALTAFNASLCAQAAAHDARCVDTRTAVNGPAWDQEALPEPAPGALVKGGDDHVHPTAAGHELVAATIAALGFDPLVLAPTP